MTPYDALPRERWAVADQASAFLSAVYGWMSLGLAITAGVAWVVAGSPAIVNTISANGVLFWGLAIVQLGIERPIAAD